MPIPNPDFDPGGKGQRKDLKFTKDLAEKERALFQERLEACQPASP